MNLTLLSVEGVQFNLMTICESEIQEQVIMLETKRMWEVFGEKLEKNSSNHHDS
jgi:hypothetical protein